MYMESIDSRLVKGDIGIFSYLLYIQVKHYGKTRKMENFVLNDKEGALNLLG